MEERNFTPNSIGCPSFRFVRLGLTRLPQMLTGPDGGWEGPPFSALPQTA